MLVGSGWRGFLGGAFDVRCVGSWRVHSQSK